MVPWDFDRNHGGWHTARDSQSVIGASAATLPVWHYVTHGVVFNTSTSGLDTDAQMRYRVGQIERLRELGIPSVNRVVTCDFGDTEWARACAERQRYLLSLEPVIDNPLRVSPDNPRVISGESE